MKFFSNKRQKFSKTWTNSYPKRNISYVARYSLKFTRCLLVVVKLLVTRCKIRLLSVAEVAHYQKSFVTCCKIHSLLVKEVAKNHLLLVTKFALITRCRNCSLEKLTRYSFENLFVTLCISRSLQKFTHYLLRNSLDLKNHSLLVAKFGRYLLHKVTKKSQYQ